MCTDDWRSIRYEEVYDWNQIPRPVKPIPLELRQFILLPKEEYTVNPVVQHNRPFSDNSAQTIRTINKYLERLRVKLEFWGLHKRTNKLIYCFKPLQEGSTVRVKNPWYNFVLVWSAGDYSPRDWFKQCFWCAKISEEYYGQKGIYMNLKKRSQRWRAKEKGKLKRKHSSPLKSSDKSNSRETTSEISKKPSTTS